MFKKRPIDLDLIHNSPLERTIGPVGLTAMGVGAVVGAGIFITPGIIAASYAGPAVILSYIVAALVCALSALCYSEFSSAIPLSGSAYTYVYMVFGELPAWIVGWALISEYLFAVASVAVSWSAYFQNLLTNFNLHLPNFLTAATGTAGHHGFGINLIAGIVTFLIGLLLAGGLRESTRLNTIMVFIKIFVIILFVGVAAFSIKASNYHPFMPFGVPGIFAGASLAFYAYIGFDAVSTASEEVKNPQKTMPIGIIASLIIASLLYAIVSFVLVGVVHYSQLNVGDPVAFVLKVIHQDWVAGIVSLGAVVGMTTVLLVMSYGGTRLLFAISRDGLLPKVFSKINLKNHVPLENTWIFAIITSALAMLIPLDIIAELVNIGTLFAFAMVSIGVIFLRRLPDYHKLPKAYHVPLYPVLPIVSFLLCIGLMLKLRPITWTVFAIWFVLGLIVYFSYGHRHSVFQKEK
ncbi:amino acid permease family protein [Agrilactobacillus composti DSM 18527 = JCM 14202]|uniref:Amino acid permease family protein n=1 Tax=Agrilactobacillus composti DSM 18527 = JCM 14202 TaxID=1423734 RepID=A0A0R1XTT3_9LACO|nr:amino acid permease [Agrilactobacillus composti]KRM33560.1 amino acid permease family protein [Agrilactobacillus composti DSM 18527 = JCM 14202]